MRLGRNLLAGLASSFWTALVGFAVVPLYLKYLGIEAYGLIGIFATTQVLLALFDFGLAPAINREVARCSVSGDMPDARNLLHTLELVYAGMALLIALLIFALAPFIASHWLRSSSIDTHSMEQALTLMGFVIACRWPTGVYLGALMGLQRLTVSSIINIATVTLGSLGGVVVLAYISATIEAFFIWQAGVALLNVFVIRYAAWRIIGSKEPTKFDVKQLKKIWRFSAGMAGITIGAIFLTQLDKVILSRMLSLEDFGRYALAGVVASSLTVFITPTFNVIYPRFTALVSNGSESELKDLYLKMTRLFCTVIFPVAFAMAAFSIELIDVWTSNEALAQSVAPIVSILVIGTVLNGVMNFPYALQLANGMVRLPFILTITLAVTLTPLIIFLTWSYGAQGGATAWLILNVIYLFWGTWLTHRHLLKGLGSKWILQGVAMPLGVASLVTYGGRLLIETQLEWSHMSRLIGSAVVGLVAISIGLALSEQSRQLIRSGLGKKI